MATKTIERYTSVDGVATKVSTEQVEIDETALIADKEAELLKVYEELEALKAQNNS